jgi:NDP-sugar pyrophosphorylase family protein
MMAVILAGGKGVRLKPFTMSIPKPLLPLGDVPIVEVVVRQLVTSGFDRIVFSLGHLAHLFEGSLGNGAKWGTRIEYIVEDQPLGTAGPLGLAKNAEDDFLVMTGDILTTLDYRRLFEEHASRQAWATIALSRREVKIDYGVVKATEDGTLGEYIEKPTIPYEVSMGINVISRRALQFIPAGVKFDIPQLMLAIKASGNPVRCHKTDCYWQDIGRFDDYQSASADFVQDPSRFLPST